MSLSVALSLHKRPLLPSSRAARAEQAYYSSLLLVPNIQKL